MTRGRPRATGRYDSRAELEHQVWELYRTTPRKQSHIARFCKVSESTVAEILKTPPHEPSPEEQKRLTALIEMRRNASVIGFALKEDVVANDGKLDVNALCQITNELLLQLKNYQRFSP